MTNDERTPTQRLDDAINDLIRPRDQHVWLDYYDPIGHRRVRRQHHIGRYSLIELLQRDVHLDDDTAPQQSGGLAGGFESRPPGRYAPRELLAALDNELGIWCDWTGIDRSPDGPAGHLTRLHHVAPKVASWSQVDYLQMIRDIETWAARLRQYAGIETTYRPRTTCPACDRIGTLTVWINTDRRTPERGACHACRTNWNIGNVGLLIEHIRTTDRPAKRISA